VAIEHRADVYRPPAIGFQRRDQAPATSRRVAVRTSSVPDPANERANGNRASRAERGEVAATPYRRLLDLAAGACTHRAHHVSFRAHSRNSHAECSTGRASDR
jgi:hypothetical protein